MRRLDDQCMDQLLSLHLLGGFAVDHGDRRVDLPPACQRVVALAALKRKPLHRLWVCATLWPHAQTRRAVASLRSAMWRLRPLGVGQLLSVDPQYVKLGDGVSVDWHDAVSLIDRLLTGDIDPHLVAELLPLLRAGGLLDTWAEPWVDDHRDRYHEMRVAAFERLGNAADHQALYGSCRSMRSTRPPHARVATRRNIDEWRDR